MQRYVDKIEQSNYIEDSYLASEELAGEYVIFIRDHEIPFRFQGAFLRAEERQSLYDICLRREIGLGQIATIENEGTEYFVAREKTPNEEREVCLCKDITQMKKSIRTQFFLLGSLYLVGTLLLHFLSRILAKRAIRPIEENQKEQYAFIHAASHELRSPLAVIRANNAALQENPQELTHFGDIIDNECERMGRLVEDLLLLASTGTAKWKLKTEEVLPDTLLLNCYESFEPMCQKQGMQLSIELPENAMEAIMIDAQRFEQVIGILINNALSYARSERGILLRLAETRREIRFEVCDYGPGIAQEDKPHIFERFYRVDNSRQDKTHFGLGLSIAKEIVSSMKMQLTVRDTESGGTTFVIHVEK